MTGASAAARSADAGSVVVKGGSPVAGIGSVHVNRRRAPGDDAAQRWQRRRRLTARWESGEQFGGRGGDQSDGPLEGGLGTRGAGLDPAHLPHVLAGSRLDLLGRGDGLQAPKHGDVAAHAEKAKRGQGAHHEAMPLTWEEVADRLVPARNYWLHTTDPAGGPQVTPVWGAVVENRLYHYSLRRTVKARNLRHNWRVAVHLESGADVVIVYGTLADVGRPVPTSDVVRAFARSMTDLMSGRSCPAPTRSSTSSTGSSRDAPCSGPFPTPRRRCDGGWRVPSGHLRIRDVIMSFGGGPDQRAAALVAWRWSRRQWPGRPAASRSSSYMAAMSAQSVAGLQPARVRQQPEPGAGSDLRPEDRSSPRGRPKAVRYACMPSTATNAGRSRATLRSSWSAPVPELRRAQVGGRSRGVRHQVGDAQPGDPVAAVVRRGRAPGR